MLHWAIWFTDVRQRVERLDSQALDRASMAFGGLIVAPMRRARPTETVTFGVGPGQGARSRRSFSPSRSFHAATGRFAP